MVIDGKEDRREIGQGGVGFFICQGPTDWRLQEGSHDGIGFAIAILIRPDHTSTASTTERTDRIGTGTKAVVMSLGSTAELVGATAR